MIRMLKIIGFILLLVVLLIAGLALRMSFNKSDDQLLEYFKTLGIPAHLNRIEIEDRTLRYLTTGNKFAERGLVFVHGAPGGLDMFNATLAHPRLQDSFFMLALDRPGYGGSGSGKSETSLRKQAEAVIKVMDQMPQKKITLLGHSFGGPIVGLVAYLQPDRVERIIIAGGAVAPEEERFVGLARVACSSMISWLSSPDTQVASEEKIAHAQELEEIEYLWEKLNCSVDVMHGTKDWMVPYGNFEFLKKRILKERFVDRTLKGESHFFFGDSVLLSGVILEK